jgi:hypothetical protein
LVGLRERQKHINDFTAAFAFVLLTIRIVQSQRIVDDVNIHIPTLWVDDMPFSGCDWITRSKPPFRTAHIARAEVVESCLPIPLLTCKLLPYPVRIATIALPRRSTTYACGYFLAEW